MGSSRLPPRRRVLGVLLALAAGVCAPTATAGERVTVAAASDLKFALDEIVAARAAQSGANALKPASAPAPAIATTHSEIRAGSSRP